MLLRASGQIHGSELDLSGLRDGAEAAEHSGVPHGELLVRFADALVAHDDTALARLRPALADALGPDGLLETATVAANFQRMVRIADATGIPQEAPILTLGGDLIEELRLREFASARNTPEPGALARLASRLLRPLASTLVPLVMRRMRGRPPG